MDPTEAVRAWHQATQLPASPRPTLDLPEAVKDLRCALIEEEAAELRASVEQGDIVGVADALGDLLYAVHAAALTFGIPIAEVFDEIHRSNMTKIGPDGTIARRADGKIMKGDHFRGPELQPILERHGLESLPPSAAR